VASSTKLIGVFVAATLAVTMMVAPSTRAEFHLMKIREIAGEQMVSNESYIELQMYAPGQTALTGHEITFWDADALVLGMPIPVAELPLGAPLTTLNGGDQRTVLIGDTGVTGRDFTLDLTPFLDGDEAANLTAAGAACFQAIPVDCVSWGGSNFTGASRLPDNTTPYDSALISLLGVSGLRRSIAGGACATALDPADDTNNADADFATGIGAGGTPNSATPTEMQCVASGTPTPAAIPTTPAQKKKCKKGQKRKKGKCVKKKRKKK
jgi:hypothetical protein